MSAKGRGDKSAAAGHYATPEWATRAMLCRMPNLHGKTVVDLGCGTGAIATVVKRAVPSVGLLGFEINKRLADQAARNVHWSALVTGDVLAVKKDNYRADAAIFNPEFEHAVGFVEAAWRIVGGGPVCCLQRLNWLGGGGSPRALPETIRRHRWHLQHPAALYVLSRRPGFLGGRKSAGGSTTDATEYSWFCWGGDFKPGTYEVIPAEQLQDRAEAPRKVRGGVR